MTAPDAVARFALPDLCVLIGNRLDWGSALLVGSAAASAWNRGDVVGAVLGWIALSRRSRSRGFGYSEEYLNRVITSATPGQRADAAHRWDLADERDLFMPFHRNTYSALGAETIALVATAERCERIADRVMQRRSEWSDYPYSFGVTHSIAELMHHLWPLPAERCHDACLVPVVAWLLAAADKEWPLMRRLGEAALGTSGHNWYIHSYMGFFMTGCFVPELSNFGRFVSLGGDYLDREVSVLFESDGWSKEGAAGYQEFAARSVIDFAHLAREPGITLKPQTAEKLKLIALAPWRLLGPDGALPGFGDDSRGGHYAGHTSELDPPDSPLLCALRARAAMSGDGEAKFVLESLDPKFALPMSGMLPYHGHDLLPAYTALEAKQPDTLDVRLPLSGLMAMRSDWSPRAEYVALLAGSIGNLIASHKHADLFTMELNVRGRWILVDNGYGAECEETRKDPRCRMWRVSSPAHNVATVDDQDCVPIEREFRYGAVVQPTVDDWRSERGYAYASVVHEGYRRSPIHIAAYRRKLFYLRSGPGVRGYWIVIDRFTHEKPGEHEYQLHFQIGVPATLRDNGELVTQGSGGNLLIHPVAGASGRATLEAHPYPIKGFDNPHHLCYRHRTDQAWSFVTLLVPFEDDRVPKVSVAPLVIESDLRELSRFEATALQITIDGTEHVYLDQHKHWNLPWKCGGFTGESRLFHSAVDR